MPLVIISQDDSEILSSFQKPEQREAAFTRLVRKYQERLYWLIRRLVICHEDADDVLQNVFIKVWRNLAGFRSDSNLYTWLYRIATNESLSFLDQQKRKHSVSLEGLEQTTDKIRAEEGFDANKLEWRLQLAIQELPEKQRIVFHLRYYDEMPYEKMSEVLETSVGALKASYHHAVKKVTAFIRED